LVRIGSFRFAGTGVIIADLAHLLDVTGHLVREYRTIEGWVLPTTENWPLRAVRPRSAASWALGQGEFGLAFSLFHRE
jgi:hypothetical protein